MQTTLERNLTGKKPIELEWRRQDKGQRDTGRDLSNARPPACENEIDKLAKRVVVKCWDKSVVQWNLMIITIILVPLFVSFFKTQWHNPMEEEETTTRRKSVASWTSQCACVSINKKVKRAQRPKKEIQYLYNEKTRLIISKNSCMQMNKPFLLRDFLAKNSNSIKIQTWKLKK